MCFSANMSAATDPYYEKVAAYYDFDSRNFEERAAQNAVLGRIRQEFRALSEPFVNGNVLEIGCGPGLDLLYWAQRKPGAKIYGIDISPGMIERARKNCERAGLSNVHLALGTVEDLETVFPGVRFDFVFCYFGALNTTRDLRGAASAIGRATKPDGAAVLTFVNRWYLFELGWSLVRGKFRRAFARLQDVWGGYATARNLESRCYAPADIQAAFGSHFSIKTQRGYSILYPAWYRHESWVKRFPRLCETLWAADRALNVTPCWRFGEYALYVLRARPATQP
jgi:ubiquinone/menaquinone biosynthesis C-methylase UbiE